MPSLGKPPLELVVFAKLIGLPVAIGGWVFGLVAGYFWISLLSVAGLFGGALALAWLISIILAPFFIATTLRRIKDTSWNSLLDPVCAGVLGAICGCGAVLIFRVLGSIEIA